MTSIATRALLIFTDGLCEPNPGHATWGWTAYDDDVHLASDRGYLGSPRTNNQAEYVAVGKALRWAVENYPDVPVLIQTDSQLVVRQIAGSYACNVPDLRKLRDRCRELKAQIPNCRVEWIPREENAEADRLSRLAYKEAIGREAPVRMEQRRAR